ncbi:uncharacterized protein L969DRAFT_42953 [Mixia osmundae IAM 14324]|uniref:uncharacterized protein n=1 Tax=Mixia osmundae (strain CBS 9802 / IAM 14324 / JCM 22182 / KY 12970) TaxID=764103 RepID=UPI0004A556E7|nr:uncharacterized protein L969DRAFT_42953 [Mixia osmundae IAM 14324]KEI42753.1 hypothetical protein L969DRAFT_42953 [Mixia osmundae IAM 14324]
MSRPEHIAPPEVFYGDTEASKYTDNSRIQSIQAEMAIRCLELLALPQAARATLKNGREDDGKSDSEDDDDDDDDDAMSNNEAAPQAEPSFLLDIGCGSGLSGEIITEHGHQWVGIDIAASMLGKLDTVDVLKLTPTMLLTEVAIQRDVEGDLLLQDIGQGFGFRAGIFDGAVRQVHCVAVVSVLQWLCNADKSHHSPAQRLATFFTTLFASLRRGARAVFQFYPESDDQVTFMMSIATRAGFGGGLVVDYPNSKKAKKFYLVLFAGQADLSGRPSALPAALGTESDPTRVQYEAHRQDSAPSKRRKGKRAKDTATTQKEWIVAKKDKYRRKGKEGIPTDSKRVCLISSA